MPYNLEREFTEISHSVIKRVKDHVEKLEPSREFHEMVEAAEKKFNLESQIISQGSVDYIPPQLNHYQRQIALLQLMSSYVREANYHMERISEYDGWISKHLVGDLQKQPELEKVIKVAREMVPHALHDAVLDTKKWQSGFLACCRKYEKVQKMILRKIPTHELSSHALGMSPVELYHFSQKWLEAGSRGKASKRILIDDHLLPHLFKYTRKMSISNKVKYYQEWLDNFGASLDDAFYGRRYDTEDPKGLDGFDDPSELQYREIVKIVGQIITHELDCSREKEPHISSLVQFERGQKLIDIFSPPPEEVHDAEGMLVEKIPDRYEYIRPEEKAELAEKMVHHELTPFLEEISNEPSPTQLIRCKEWFKTCPSYLSLECRAALAGQMVDHGTDRLLNHTPNMSLSDKLSLHQKWTKEFSDHLSSEYRVAQARRIVDHITDRLLNHTPNMSLSDKPSLHQKWTKEFSDHLSSEYIVAQARRIGDHVTDHLLNHTPDMPLSDKLSLHQKRTEESPDYFSPQTLSDILEQKNLPEIKRYYDDLQSFLDDATNGIIARRDKEIEHFSGTNLARTLNDEKEHLARIAQGQESKPIQALQQILDAELARKDRLILQIETQIEKSKPYASGQGYCEALKRRIKETQTTIDIIKMEKRPLAYQWGISTEIIEIGKELQSLQEELHQRIRSSQSIDPTEDFMTTSPLSRLRDKMAQLDKTDPYFIAREIEERDASLRALTCNLEANEGHASTQTALEKGWRDKSFGKIYGWPETEQQLQESRQEKSKIFKGYSKRQFNRELSRAEVQDQPKFKEHFDKQQEILKQEEDRLYEHSKILKLYQEKWDAFVEMIKLAKIKLAIQDIIINDRLIDFFSKMNNSKDWENYKRSYHSRKDPERIAITTELNRSRNVLSDAQKEYVADLKAYGRKKQEFDGNWKLFERIFLGKALTEKEEETEEE